MPPAFAPDLPAHCQGHIGSNLMGEGAIRRLERNMQARPSHTGRGRTSSYAHGELRKSYARGEPKRAPLDTATCAHDAWVTCNILRIYVLKRFSFRRINWNWEWKCLWTCGGGRIASGLDGDNGLPRAHAPSTKWCRKNRHKPSQFPRRHKRSKSDDPAQRKKGHVSRLLRNGRLM